MHRKSRNAICTNCKQSQRGTASFSKAIRHRTECSCCADSAAHDRQAWARSKSQRDSSTDERAHSTLSDLPTPTALCWCVHCRFHPSSSTPTLHGQRDVSCRHMLSHCRHNTRHAVVPYSQQAGGPIPLAPTQSRQRHIRCPTQILLSDTRNLLLTAPLCTTTPTETPTPTRHAALVTAHSHNATARVRWLSEEVAPLPSSSCHRSSWRLWRLKRPTCPRPSVLPRRCRWLTASSHRTAPRLAHFGMA